MPCLTMTATTKKMIAMTDLLLIGWKIIKDNLSLSLLFIVNRPNNNNNGLESIIIIII